MILLHCSVLIHCLLTDITFNHAVMSGLLINKIFVHMCTILTSYTKLIAVVIGLGQFQYKCFRVLKLCVIFHCLFLEKTWSLDVLKCVPESCWLCSF